MELRYYPDVSRGHPVKGMVPLMVQEVPLREMEKTQFDIRDEHLLSRVWYRKPGLLKFRRWNLTSKLCLRHVATEAVLFFKTTR